MLAIELRKSPVSAGSRRPVEFSPDGPIAGITVARTTAEVDGASAIADLIDRLDEARGGVFTSGFEYPGRYSRWDTGFVDPPIAITVERNRIRAGALNERGAVLVPVVRRALENADCLDVEVVSDTAVEASPIPDSSTFFEEERVSLRASRGEDDDISD